MTEFTEPIVISIIGGSIAVLSLIFRLMYKSKCSDVEIGCIKIHRNTSQELQQQDVKI
jgi:ABC-type transport system involved in Fe-S cluster assembly fused permease/ATPase subunit